MITPDTVIQLFPDYVEFRTPTNHGARVVKVYTTLATPRIMAWSEWVIDDERRREPLSLTLDEIDLFCEQAWACSNKDFTFARRSKVK